MNPRKAVEGGTNTLPDQAVGRCKNMSLGTALEARCVTGTAMDRFVQMNECAVEPVAVADRDMWAGAGTVEWMHMLTGAWRCQASQ